MSRSKSGHSTTGTICIVHTTTYIGIPNVYGEGARGTMVMRPPLELLRCKQCSHFHRRNTRLCGYPTWKRRPVIAAPSFIPLLCIWSIALSSASFREGFLSPSPLPFSFAPHMHIHKGLAWQKRREGAYKGEGEGRKNVSTSLQKDPIFLLRKRGPRILLQCKPWNVLGKLLQVVELPKAFCNN